MANEPAAQSKFVAFFQSDAASDNNKPSMKGTFTLPTGEAYSIALWSGEREDGKGLYLTGQATAQDVNAALKARHQAANDEQGQGMPPPGLTLTNGQLVLFETPAEQLAENRKRPNFYGYAHTAEGYFRIAAWNRKTSSGGPMLAGSIELNRPQDQAEDRFEPEVPQPRAGRGRATRAGAGTA